MLLFSKHYEPRRESVDGLFDLTAEAGPWADLGCVGQKFRECDRSLTLPPVRSDGEVPDNLAEVGGQPDDDLEQVKNLSHRLKNT